MAKNWDNDAIKSFVDYDGTKFFRGPFEIDGQTYDYKLVDRDGEDYCTRAQMESWDIELKHVLAT